MTAQITAVSTLRVVRAAEADGFHAGGTVTYRVLVGDRWVGWVGDGREWRGWRYGARRWWSCWREDRDTAARWNSDLTHRTRTAALTDLVTHVAARPNTTIEPGPVMTPASNPHRVGSPNHLQGSGETYMVGKASLVSNDAVLGTSAYNAGITIRRARAIRGYGPLFDCGMVEGHPWPLEYAPRWKTDHHPWRLTTQHAMRYASYEVYEDAHPWRVFYESSARVEGGVV